VTALTLCVALGLVLLNGAFVAVEFAAVGARRGAIAQRAALGQRSAIAAERLQSDLLLTLTAAQLGITVCSLALGRLAEPVIADLLEGLLDGLLSEAALHGVSFAVALGLVVLVHTLIGEIVPKNLTLASPERSLLILAGPMAVYYSLARPLAIGLKWLANAILRLVRIEPASSLIEVATVIELDLMVAESHQEGLIDAEERAILEGALHFSQTRVDSVMAPMATVDAVALSAPVEEVERLLVETDHARLVVFGADRTDVRGFVHSKDLLSVDPAARHRPLPVRRVRPMLPVAPGATLADVLRLMQRTRTHLALVTHHGEALGVATLDDVFGGLVGGLVAPE
jgi:CBS domain containing-hemolysin-like protein